MGNENQGEFYQMMISDNWRLGKGMRLVVGTFGFAVM